MKNKKCPFCKSNAVPTVQNYNSGKLDKTGKHEIVVHNVVTYKCLGDDCGNSWLPLDQERKIQQEIARQKC